MSFTDLVLLKGVLQVRNPIKSMYRKIMKELYFILKYSARIRQSNGQRRQIELCFEENRAGVLVSIKIEKILS